MNAFFKFMLRGSAVGALVFVGAATGCSDDDKDDSTGAAGDSGSKAGSSNQAGSSSHQAGAGDGGGDPGAQGGAAAGGAGAGGAAAGGAPEGGAPEATGGASEAAGGQGGADAGIAVAKFCNSLTFGDDEDTTMILEVGVGPAKVTFTATTGECVPADGAACTAIPTGPAVLVQMFDADDRTLPLDSSPLAIDGGEQYFFYTDLDNGEPIWNGSKINQEVATCDEFTYSDVP